MFDRVECFLIAKAVASSRREKTNMTRPSCHVPIVQWPDKASLSGKSKMTVVDVEICSYFFGSSGSRMTIKTIISR